MADKSKIPVPVPTPETEHFWSGTRAGQLKLQRCTALPFHPPLIGGKGEQAIPVGVHSE